MIKLIYGEKGTGKTKQIIDEANQMVETSKGNVAFITDTNKYNFSLKHTIRLIDANDFSISADICLLGFVSGLIAGNADLQYIYIDGAARMSGLTISQMEKFYLGLETIANKKHVTIILTVSEKKENLPKFLTKFL